MSKKPNFAAQFDEQPDDEAGDFKRVYGGLKLPAGLQQPTAELTALEWVHKSPTALTIDTELNEAEWFALLASIEIIHKRYQWYLGDAMVYGIRRKYGETDDQIQRIVELTGKAAPTLHEYYKTALLFEIHERSENLDFEQHRVLAVEFSQDTPEHRAERLRWLHTAETQQLSGRKLKAEIAAAYLPAPAGDATSPDNERPAINEDEMIPRPAPALNDHEKKELSFFFKAIRRNKVETITPDKIVLIRKALESAERLLNYYARQHE